MIPLSVVVPAHNEEAVIGRLLRSILSGAEPGEVEIVVGANGCTDATVQIARSFPEVTVVEVAQASKIAGLNAADEAATRFPRFYVDADVVVSIHALRRCAEALSQGPALCVAPTAVFDLTGVSPAVARFYRVWQQIPYFTEDRIGMVYGLSAEGRARFDRYPDITADDQFVAQTFAKAERRCLPDCTFTVNPPRTVGALLANRTRIYRGNRELAASGLAPHGPPGGSPRFLARRAANPAEWPALATYALVNLEAKRRARRPFDGWERDDTSRPVAPDRAIGYVVSHYPARSHTFVLREVQQLRRLGATVETFSIHATPPEQQLSPADRQEAETTTNLRPVRPGRLFWSHAAVAMRHPSAYLGSLALALRSSPPGLRSRVWQAFYFAEAVLLYRAARAKGVRHLHAHLANAGADVAWLAADLGRRAGPGEGWRWSFTMHGPTEFYAVERFNLARKVKAASVVVCISEYCRSQLMLVSEPPDWGKLRVVHCGVDTSEFTPAAPRRSHDRPWRILCVGRLTPEKGQHVLVEAAAHLVARGERLEVVLVGWGPSEAGLRAEVKRLGLDDVVRFAGPVGADRLAEQFAAADVFCLPSFAEGVPVVLMEAMASGLPVVTTPVAGIPELVRDGESGILVSPGRADALADALAGLMRNRPEAARLAANGRRTVEKDFDIEVNCRLLLDVLRDRP